MKKMMISTATCGLLLFANVFGQSFVETMEPDDMGGLYGNECFLELRSGEVVHGVFTGAVFVSNGFSKITVRLDNGEKQKFPAGQIASLSIRTSNLLRLMMISESTASVKKMANTDYDALLNREFVVFESALTPKKSDTWRLLQLLNDGYDGRMKVFAEPSAKTGGFSVDGVQLTGGEDAAYLFVKGGEKAFKVRKISYSKNFEELYGDCPEMTEAFRDEKLKWDDVALHVFFFNQFCGQ
jgi:hypothetical protein